MSSSTSNQSVSSEAREFPLAKMLQAIYPEMTDNINTVFGPHPGGIGNGNATNIGQRDLSDGEILALARGWRMLEVMFNHDGPDADSWDPPAER